MSRQESFARPLELDHWRFPKQGRLLPQTPCAVLLPLENVFGRYQWKIVGPKSRVGFVSGDGSPKIDDWQYEFGGARVRDGWEIRQHFLAVQTIDDALAFLNAVGCFCGSMKALSFAGLLRIKEYVSKCMMLPQEQWKEHRELLRELRRGDGAPAVGASLERRPKLELPLDEERPISKVVCSWGALQAIGATLFIDKFLGAQYGVCARPDCPTVYFEHVSKHSRKYCSPECAHVMAVRGWRGRRADTSGRPARTRK
jgi:hypothetical protein